MSINPPVQVSTSDRFESEIRQLGKRYRRIRLDIQPIIEQLEAGEPLGDQIPDMDCDLFKVRIKNSDARRGKSGGHRIIYYVKTEDSILLMTIYSKSDKSDVPAAEIRELLSLPSPKGTGILADERSTKAYSKMPLPTPAISPLRILSESFVLSLLCCLPFTYSESSWIWPLLEFHHFKANH